MAVKVFIQFIVGLFFWPFAVPMGFVLGFLYTFYPATLVNGFIKYGGYLTMPGFSNQPVQVDGVNIYYLDRPATSPDQPTLVFVHGFTSQKLCWVPLIRYIPTSWRIVAVDLPGHGESGIGENWNCSANGISSLLFEVFKEIGLTRFHIIGESLGSAYAGQFASLYPDMIDSIITLCPPVLHRLKDFPCTPTMAAIDNSTGIKNPLLPTTPQELRSMLDTVLHNSRVNLLQDHMLEAVVDVHSKHYQNFERVLHDVRNGGDTEADIKARIKRSKHIPSLVLWGKQDQVCDVRGAKLLKKLSPHTKVVVIKNCGHCMSMEKPKKCGHFIEQFVLQHNPTSHRLLTVSE